MSNRGRVRQTRGIRKKLAALPNLEAAGKRESPVNTVQRDNRGTNRARGRKRNETSRGRGQRRDRKKAIIEQQGIFSQGFNNEHLLANRCRNSEGTLSLHKLKQKELNNKVKFEQQPSGSGICRPNYHNEWLSDSEEEYVEKELLDDNFISDLKNGTLVPDVLPVAEERKLERLCFYINKNEIEEDVELSPHEIKSINELEKQKSTEMEVEENGWKDSNQMNCDKLLKTLCQNEDSSYVVLQMPATAFSWMDVVDEKTSTNCELERVKLETIDSHAKQSEGNNEIGKVVIRQSGHMELYTCDIKFNVNYQSTSEMRNNSLMVVEVPPKEDSMSKLSFLSNKEPKRKSNKMNAGSKSTAKDEVVINGDAHVVGRISGKIICSHSVPLKSNVNISSLELNVEETHKSGINNSSNEVKDNQMRDELEAIKKLEKTWSKWVFEYDKDFSR